MQYRNSVNASGTKLSGKPNYISLNAHSLPLVQKFSECLWHKTQWKPKMPNFLPVVQKFSECLWPKPSGKSNYICPNAHSLPLVQKFSKGLWYKTQWKPKMPNFLPVVQKFSESLWPKPSGKSNYISPNAHSLPLVQKFSECLCHKTQWKPKMPILSM